MIDNQFYPTPRALAIKAWSMFDNKRIIRLLEPEAGRGDMINALEHSEHSRYSGPFKSVTDCVEIDLQNQAILRDAGFRVIDGDFLSFQGRGAMYSHILMNPPFANGVKHVLRAWEILYSGELVAIINAAGVLNPKTKEERLLMNVINDYGEYDILEAEFLTEDTQRKTAVTVALVHLQKSGSLLEDFFTQPLRDMKRDDGPENVEQDAHFRTQLALPASTISNTVKAFNLAVVKMRAAVIAEDESAYYRALISLPIDKAADEPKDGDIVSVQSEVNKRYDDLRERAWRMVLNATEFTSRLSAKAQKRLEASFEHVSKMEFTEANIYGLLVGLVSQKDEMDREMICDVFDQFSRFHSGNRAYYLGWKSNDKHRTMAYRLKMTRFILPIGGGDWGIQYDRRQEVYDIDKVFAMMDGKSVPGTTVADKLREPLDSDVKHGERVTTEYFDFRYYKGSGTLHLFPRRPDLVDRMNRVVGRMRAWLPDEQTSSPEFWGQYDEAEKVTRKMDEIANRQPMRSRWDDEREPDRLLDVHAQACEKLKIPLPNLIESDERKRLAS